MIGDITLTKYTAANILKGQAEIDRERREINWIIQRLLDLFGRYDIQKRFEEKGIVATKDCGAKAPKNDFFRADNEGYYWSFDIVSFALWQKGRQLYTDAGGRPLPVFWSHKPEKLWYRDVIAVHSRLDQLLDDFLDMFPEMKKELDPFIEAAVAAE